MEILILLASYGTQFKLKLITRKISLFLYISVNHAPWHMMYGCISLVPMNERVLSKLSKERNINGHK